MENSKNKILVVVEGEVTEPRILKNDRSGLLSFFEEDYEIVPFKNPIYELYDAYKKGEYDSLVAYLRYEKGLQIDEGILSKTAFRAIYLIFDFESQDNKYSDEKIKQLLDFFDNETENGKLYINYPMVEAFYHLENLPDPYYNERTVSLNGLNGEIYKRCVNTTSILRKNRLYIRELCYIIMHNYNKAVLLGGKVDGTVDQKKILKTQLNIKKSKNEIYVLSCFPLILTDYNLERTLEVLKLNLKDDFVESD